MSYPVVLVVDPDVRVARIIDDLLRERGMVTQAVSTDDEALQILTTQTVAALFCELTLPQRDGIGLCVEAQRLQTVGCVIMTDRPSVESSVEALRNGVCDYLFKPITPHKILAAWQRILRATQRSGEIIPRAKVANFASESRSQFAPIGPDKSPPLEDHGTVTVALQGDLKSIERNLVRQVVLRFDGNKTAAAKALGMHRKTLYRVLERTHEE